MKLPWYEILGGILGVIIITMFCLLIALWPKWMVVVWVFAMGGAILYTAAVVGVFLIGKPLKDYMAKRRSNV